MTRYNTQWLLQNLDHNSVIFDIGAADLGDSILYKRLLGCAVHAFECSNQWLENNIKTSTNNGIHYHHCALGNINGQVPFYPSLHHAGESWPWSGSICKPYGTSENLTFDRPYYVTAITLDHWCELFNIVPCYIHIDVQGAEYQVLSNMGMVRPKAIWAEICEFNSHYDTGVTFEQFNELLTTLGYTLDYRDNHDAFYILSP